VPNTDATKRAINGVAKVLDDRRGSLSYSPLHVQSPRSTSGASTPVHSAPPAPSMLPRASSAGAIPLTLASVRRIKLKKQAILTASKPQGENANCIPSLSSQLEAQEKDNLQLVEMRKSNEDLALQMQEFKACLDQFQSRVAMLEKKKDASNRTADLDTVARRINESKSNTDIKNEIYAKVAQDKEAMQQQVALVETRLDSIIKENEKTQGTVKILTSGFNSLDKQMKSLSDKVSLIENNEGKTYFKATKNADAIGDLEKEMKQTSKDIRDIRMTRKDFDKNNDILEQTKSLQSEQGRLAGEQKRLTQRQDVLSVENNALKARLSVLEKKGSGLGQGFVKVGSPVTKPSPERGQADTDVTAQQLKRFGDDIKELQSSVKESQACTGAATEQLKLFGDNIKEIQSSLNESQASTAAQQWECFRNEIKELQSFAKKSQADTGATAQQLNHVSDQIIKLQTSVKDNQALALQISHIDAHLKRLDEIPATVSAVMLHSTELGSDLATLKDRVTNSNHATADLQDLQPRLSVLSAQDKLSDIYSRLADVEQNFSDLDAVVEGVERTIHGHESKIEVLQEDLPKMLSAQFDPFKQQLNHDREVTNSKVEKLQQDVIMLQQIIRSSAETEAAHKTFESLKQEVIKLQQNVISETALRVSNIAFLEKQLSGKADTNILNQQMDQLKHSFRVLQDQYNNVTTDELHGKMVHWILQHYPTSTAHMQQQYGSLHQEVKGLQDLFAQIAWIQPRSQDLITLLNASTQLEHLLQSADAITGLQQSFQNLNSTSSPFVRVSVINEVIKRLDFLGNDMQEIKTAFATMVDRVNQLDGTSSTLCQDVGKIINDFVEPNREALAMYPSLIELVGKIQVVVESICQKLPTKDGKPMVLQPDWTFRTQPFPLILEHGEASKNGTGKQ
jgi:chromosome segregation ATPase